MDRLPCSVAGCRGSTGKWSPPVEWICSKHWARLTKAERRVFYRAKRQAKRFGVWTATHARIWRSLVRRAAA